MLNRIEYNPYGLWTAVPKVAEYGNLGNGEPPMFNPGGVAACIATDATDFNLETWSVLSETERPQPFQGWKPMRALNPG